MIRDAELQAMKTNARLVHDATDALITEVRRLTEENALLVRQCEKYEAVIKEAGVSVSTVHEVYARMDKR